MKIILVHIILLIFSFSIYANTYYVATSGSDTNPGTETQPWASIQKAANTLMAGDTVFIKAGTYHERVIIQNSGTSNHHIVFSNYQSDTVIIDGDGISWGGSWNGLFDISDKSYIQIHGLQVKNANYGGFWIENSDHIIVEHCYTYNTFSSGIGVWNSSNITIDNNEIELACNDGEQECITVSNSHDCEIYENNVHDNGSGANGGEGIDIKQGSHDINVYKNIVHHLNERIGIYADAWDTYTHNINIYQNIVHDCGNNGMVVQSEMGGTIEYVSFYNNIVYRNKWDGIAVGSVTASDDVTSTPVHHIKIINNSLYQNGGILDGWGFGILVNNPDAYDIIIRNNICSENSAQIGIQQIEYDAFVDHNLFDGNNTASGALYGDDSTIGDPLFADSDTYDFHLLYNSPAIDNGSSTGAPDVDFENHSRPFGSGYDIGAYEYSPSSAVPDDTEFENFFEIYPNPCSDHFSMKIHGKKQQNYSLQIYDSKGTLIYNRLYSNMINNSLVFYTKKLKPGLYLLVLSSTDRIGYKKLMIR